MSASRRPRNTSRSRVASSAQCTSSMTTTVGCSVSSLQERVEAVVPAGVAGHHRSQVATVLVGEVVQRLQGPGSGERLAGADQVGQVEVLDEGAHEAGLADAGFAADEHDAATEVQGAGQEAGQVVELSSALQKRHPLIVDLRPVRSAGKRRP